MGLSFVDTSLQATLHKLTLEGTHMAADKLRKEFKVPDKRYNKCVCFSSLCLFIIRIGVFIVRHSVLIVRHCIVRHDVLIVRHTVLLDTVC